VPERFLCQDDACWITPDHAARRRRERCPDLTLDPTLLCTPLDFGRDGRSWLVDALSLQVVSDQLVGDEWTGIRRETFLDRCHEAARLLAALAAALA
jgi:hypothetical protein